MKTHLRADQWQGDGKVVFIQRDPRDVAVSAAFYLGISLSAAIENMCVKSDEAFDVKRHIYHKPGWYNDFVRGWLEERRERLPLDSSTVFCIGYEDLHFDSIRRLRYLACGISDKQPSLGWISDVYARQHFSNWKSAYPHAMRKGIVGDWRNHFEPHHLELITEHLGKLMLEQGYIKSLDWWENEPH